jgi:DNA-binding transcriptional MerR regulator
VTQDLISKKDLLIETGISYGQLYRWKRKKLIPEEWFIRKSTFTGQETFFLKDKVLERVERIKRMKDNLSLDDMVHVFSGQKEPLAVSFTKQEVLERNIVSSVVLEQFAQSVPLTEHIPFGQICLYYLIDKLLREGKISRSEGDLIYQTVYPQLQHIQQQNGVFYFIRKMGVPVVTVISPQSEAFFDQEVGLVAKVAFQTLFDEVKANLQGGSSNE